MKEKTKLKVIRILCIISLIITVFSIQKTYARYFEKVKTTYDTHIKRWVIKVNDTKIHDLEKDELSQIMTPVFRENQHMNNNNSLIPGREGYFEFLIDYSEVDLAFRFDVDFKQLNKTIIDDEEVDNFLTDLEIYGYSIVETDAATGTQTETITELETVNDYSALSQEIDPTVDSDTTKKLQYRVLFRWNDENADTEDANEEDGMNNYEDTQYTGTSIEGDVIRAYLNYRVRVTFTQKV